MASPSVTHTLSNGSVIDAGQLNTNFTDIINSLTDGLKDLSISALTCAGNVSMNANVTLGNASGDDVTITGSLASSIPIKTTYSYDIGSATLGLRKLYLGSDDSGAFSTYLEAGTNSSSYGLKLPDADGASADFIQTDGSGQLSFVGGPSPVAKTTTYTATTADKVITVATSSAWTLTLYAASGNAGRTLKVIKTSSDINALTIDGNASETINGASAIYLSAQYEWVELLCDGSNWIEIDRGPRYIGRVVDRKNSGNDGGSASADTVHTRDLTVTEGDFTKFGSLSSNQFTLSPGKYFIEARAPAYITERHQIFLYDVTNTSYVKDGESAYSGSAADGIVATHAEMQHSLSITATTAYEIRHYTISARATDGLGIDADGSSNPNTYNYFTTVKITKLG